MDKLISQQAAIDALKDLTANGTNKGMVFGEDAVHRIEMLPSVQSDTTTHDSIPAKTGKNDDYGTSGDCISRTQAIDALKEKVFHNLSDEFYGAMQVLDELPSVQPETNCSEIPNNSDTISRQAAIEPEAISKWKKEFREYVDSLDIARDDWKGIIEYIDELPSIQLGTNLAEVGTDLVSRQAAVDTLRKMQTYKLFAGDDMILIDKAQVQTELMMLPPAEPKMGRWILDRSGQYCCSECMEPCAGYVMMKPRDKFCKMCGSRNEVME